MAASSPYWEPVAAQVWGMSTDQVKSGVITNAEIVADFDRTTARCEACCRPVILIIRKGMFVRNVLCAHCFPWLGQDLPEVPLSC